MVLSLKALIGVKTPLVSCIMPTKNRRSWVEQSLVMFSEQTYPNRELIVLDDGDDGLSEICVGAPNVVYERLNKSVTLGEKRNIACEISTGGYIACWDDDDIQHVDRLSRQMRCMRDKWWVDVCGTDQAYYWDEANKQAYWYQYCLQPLPPFVLGNTLCFRRDYWNDKRFEHVNGNEDMRFQFTSPLPTIEVLLCPLLVGRVIGSNAFKDFSSPVWTPNDMSLARLKELMSK